MEPGLAARFGLIGDIHAEDRLLAVAIDWLIGRRVDRLLCTGDLVDGVGDAGRCCSLLAQAGVLTVRGNHDRWLLEGALRDLPDATPPAGLGGDGRAFLSGLPATRELTTRFGPVLLCHGLGTNDMSRLTPDDYGYAIEVNEDLHALLRAGRYPWVIHGHTHRPMVRHFAGLTLINPGTLRRDDGPGVAILDLEAGLFERAELGTDGGIGATIRVGLNGSDWPGCGRLADRPAGIRPTGRRGMR